MGAEANLYLSKRGEIILKLIEYDIDKLPTELQQFLYGAKIYDCSCSPEARVIFIDKDDGYFLKSAKTGALEREAFMTKYLHGKGLAAEVLSYISADCDYLLSCKVSGDDGTSAKYLEQPQKLCDTFAEQLVRLHSMDYSDCPIQNHTEQFLALAERNKNAGVFDTSEFPERFGDINAEKAWEIVKSESHMLKTNTLLHGDYCLPNIILNDWNFGGFIDLDRGGVGDKHVDIYWGLWTLIWNMKTDKYRQRFIDAYGRDKVEEDILRIVAAVEVFG